MSDIDFFSLRKDLINYFGTASSYYPQALLEVSKIKNASNQELIKIAMANNFDLENYKDYER